MDTLHGLSPEAGCFQDIGLIDQSHLAAAPEGILKGDMGDTFYFFTGIYAVVECCVSGGVAASRLAEIDSAREFAHYYEIRTRHALVFKRRRVQKAVIRLYWAYVGI